MSRTALAWCIGIPVLAGLAVLAAYAESLAAHSRNNIRRIKESAR